MVDIQLIKNSEPDEKILCELITTRLFGVAVDECCTEEQIATVIDGIYYFSHFRNGEKCKVFIVGQKNNTPFIRKLVEKRDISFAFEFVSETDTNKLLTAFLGACAFITSDADSNCTTLAEEFYLPRLCLSNDITKLSKGVLYINSTPEDLGSALLIVDERKYSDELSGHKKLV